MTPTLRAALWMLGAIVSFTSMAIAGREVSFELDTFEIMLYRSIVGIAVVVLLAKLAGTWDQVSPRRIGLHGIRNLAHFTGQNLWFYALTAIPLAQVFAMEFTTPIWAMLMAPFLLGERITRINAISALLGFTGILIVSRPDFSALNPGIIAAAAAAIFFALTANFTRKLTRSESITCIMVWLTVIQATLGLICAGYDGDIALPSATTAPWLILIALAGLLAHFCLTKALSIAPASTVLPIDFLRLPLIVTIGAMFYNEPVEVWVFVGAVLIFMGNWLNLRRPKGTQ